MNATNDNTEEPIELLFTLTRLQRMICPLDRFSHILLFIITVSVFTIIAVLIPSKRPVTVISEGLLIFIQLFVFRYWELIGSLLYSLIKNEYYNTVIITDRTISFGLNHKIMSTAPVKSEYNHNYINLIDVVKGLFGTIELKHAHGFSIVIPQSCISYKRLKELLEND